MVTWNSASGGFAYIWQSKWVGIIAIKTERMPIHFLSEVLVAVASLDLKVPNGYGQLRVGVGRVGLPTPSFCSILLPFSKTRAFWSSKVNCRLRFSLPSIILADLLKIELHFNGFKRSWFVICDWWISIRFVCLCVSRFFAFDLNYDWRQRKTQLWRWLLNLEFACLWKAK